MKFIIDTFNHYCRLCPRRRLLWSKQFVSHSINKSHIRRLDPEERITEIAKMLSGSQITEAALAQARILLDK